MNLNTLSSLAILPVVYFTRGIDFTEVTEQGASNLFHLRLAFGVVQVLVLMASIFIRMRIMASENTAAGKREILVTPPKAPMQAEEPVPKRMTVFEYDLEQWNSALKSNVVQLLILGLIHYKWAVAIPLVTQLIMGPLKVVSSELFQSHVLGKEVPRPFEVPKSPFAEMFSNLTGGGAAAEEPKPKKAKSIETSKKVR